MNSLHSVGWLIPTELVDEPVQACLDSLDLPPVKDLAQAKSAGFSYLLTQQDHLLQLLPVDKKKGGPLAVEFDSGATAFRRQTGGIKQEIAKACGLKKDFRPVILDATAGLGGDAFVLASLGCQMHLVEQHPLVYCLLASGVYRTLNEEYAVDGDVRQIVSKSIHLKARQSSQEYLRQSEAGSVDVVYLDPMFPERKKSAKVKKAMQYFHDIVGFDDSDEVELLALARKVAAKRVVVKRPKQAPLLAEETPSLQIASKTIRYDIYLAPSAD